MRGDSHTPDGPGGADLLRRIRQAITRYDKEDEFGHERAMDEVGLPLRVLLLIDAHTARKELGNPRRVRDDQA